MAQWRKRGRRGVLVFISYNTADREKAQAVEAALAARHPDFEWYLAPRNVAGGAYWIPRLADTIARSDVVLFLAGRQIGNWQELEYHETLRLSRERTGRPLLVPVVIAGQAPGLPFFAQFHQIFALDPAAPESLAAIERALEDTLPPEASPTWQRFQPYKGLPALVNESHCDERHGWPRDAGICRAPRPGAGSGRGIG
jgi:hypothetical protein